MSRCGGPAVIWEWDRETGEGCEQKDQHIFIAVPPLCYEAFYNFMDVPLAGPGIRTLANLSKTAASGIHSFFSSIESCKSPYYLHPRSFSTSHIML